MDWIPFTLIRPLYLLFLVLIPIIWISIMRSPLREAGRLGLISVGGIRTLLIVALGLALSDPRIMGYSERVNLFFCLDQSKSVGYAAEKAARTFMERAATHMDEEDTAGLILFGKEPSLEIDLTSDFEPDILRSQVNTDFTNIREPLQMAIGMLSQKGKNRIVLFSDGNQNIDDSDEAAFLGSSLGIEVYPVPLSSWFREDEVYVKKLETPSRVPMGAPLEIRLLVESSKESEAGLILLKEDKVLVNQEIKLASGKNIFRFPDTMEDQGLHIYRAVINMEEDILSDNNEGISFTRGSKRPEILYLSQENRGEDNLEKALSAQGLSIKHKRVEDLSGAIHDLADYSAIILDNVSAYSFSPAALENLERYVRDMGGGLVMIGGDRSFGAGHYGRTLVEKAMPVFMDVPATFEFPGFCLVLVIDKSNSMTERLKRKSKLEGAKIAAFSTVEMLNPIDRVGVLAFDSVFEWTVPITQAMERKSIAGRLSTLKGSGGTELYPGLEEAFSVLRTVRAAKKHIIVLSDGLTAGADFHSLVHSMREAGITVSTVAVGHDSDIKLMNSIAEWGGGRSYFASDAENIPRIFVSETRIATEDVIVERSIQAYPETASEIMQGIPADRLPPVDGLVITYPKPDAVVLLNTQEGPLLAVRQYGLGRSVAFTSDLSGRWGREWVLWDHYGRFLSQVVRWAQRKETQRNYTVDIQRKGDKGAFTADVTDDQNRFINNLDLKTRILFPSKTDLTISLDQISPGRYMGHFPAEQVGEYYLNLFSLDVKNGASQSQIFGFGIPYADEYSENTVDYAMLERIASITGGRLLKPDENPAGLFSTNSETRESTTPLWPYLALASLLLFILDIIVRRLYTLGRIT